MTSEQQEAQGSAAHEVQAHQLAEERIRNERARLVARIDNDFKYHAPTGDKGDRHENVRDILRRTAEAMVRLCPPSRELSCAITHLEEAMMWANAAIARNE